MLTDFFEKYWVKTTILIPESLLPINSRATENLSKVSGTKLIIVPTKVLITERKTLIRSPGKKNVKCEDSTILNLPKLFSQLAVLCSISSKSNVILNHPLTSDLPSSTLLRSSILSSLRTTSPEFFPLLFSYSMAC